MEQAKGQVYNKSSAVFAKSKAPIEFAKKLIVLLSGTTYKKLKVKRKVIVSAFFLTLQFC